MNTMISNAKQEIHMHKVQAGRDDATPTIQKKKNSILLFHLNSMEGPYFGYKEARIASFIFLIS